MLQEIFECIVCLKRFKDARELQEHKCGEGVGMGKPDLGSKNPRVEAHRDGLDLVLDQLPNGKWVLSVNGADLIFDSRPNFTIP